MLKRVQHDIFTGMTTASQSSKNKLLDAQRSSSLERVLKSALQYHFDNFSRLELLGKPYPQDQRISVLQRMQANTNIKFEAQAYLIHLRRLRHFIKYLEANHLIQPPLEEENLEIWNDILKKNGKLNLLANKWAAHRSFDDERGEDIELHLEVLLNLEGTVTFWSNNHLSLSIDTTEFCLHEYHPKVLKFIDWLFNEINSKR